MYVIVTDLCGRVEPKTVELRDAADHLGLNEAEVEFIEDQIADDGVAYVGEMEYKVAV